MAKHSRLEISEDGEVTVVRFRDSRFGNLAEIEQVGDDFRQLLEKSKHGRFVIDFSGVDFLSSALLGKLISLNTKAQARKGSVRLCNLPPGVVEIFHTSRLDRVFSINEDVAEALRSF
jgi:anti-anti-sigma factor